MPRLFVAIDTSDEVKEKLSGLKTNIPTARWVRPEQMHLTLKFIGADVPADRVEPIKSALGGIRAAPFELTVQGTGRFPGNPHKPPTVLWVGLSEPPELLELQRQVENVLKPLGFRPEKRPFSPHITLARLKAFKPVPELDRFIEKHHRFMAGVVQVNEFILFESKLTPQGAEYTQEAVYPLTELG